MVEWASQNDCCQPLYSPGGKSQLLPASLEGSPKLVNMSDPRFFQIIASMLGFEVCGIFFMPLKKKWNLFPRALCLSFTTAFTACCSGSSNSWYKTSGLGSTTWDFGPLLLGGTSAVVIVLRFVGCLSVSVGLDYSASLPFLPISLCF